MQRIYKIIAVILLMTQMFSCKTGLIAYYPFNEKANDKSKNKINGVVEGAIISYDRNDKSKSSYYFDGVNDYIIVKSFGDVINDKEITVSLWAKSLISKPQFQMMLCPNDNRFAISINYFHDKMNTIFWDYGWQGESGDAPGRLYYRPEPFDTLWHHYVFVSSITENCSKIYKDKKLLIEKNEPRALIGKENRDLIIGSGDHAFFFKGYIDDLRIFKRALNIKEIEKLFDQ